MLKPWQIIQGLWALIFELWRIKLCPSDFSFDCMHPQVWQRPEINLNKDEKCFMQHSCHWASLKRSCLDTDHQFHSYKHVKLLNSSNNWAFCHVSGFRYQKLRNLNFPKAFFPLWWLKLQRESPRRFLHHCSTTNCAKHKCILQFESCSVCLPVCGCFFLFCVKLNKRPVSHLAGY